MTLSEYQKLQKDVSGRSGRSRLYRIWDNMLGRCYRRSKGKIYERYGGRGIEVCDEWRKDYLAFAAYSLEKGYDDSLEIDRIDNERGYSPDNCRFVSHRENNRNRRNCRMITYGGKRQFMVESASASLHGQRSWALITTLCATGSEMAGPLKGPSAERLLMMRQKNKHSVPDPPEPGYQSLANEILILAVSDLRLALQANGNAAKVRAQESVQFLCDGRTAMLTGLNLREVVRKVFEECNADPIDFV